METTRNELPGRDRATVEREIADLRLELGVVVHEIEHRARQALNVRRQVRLHPVLTFGVVAALAGLTILAIAYPIHRRRRRRPPSRLRNLRVALAHLMAHPEDVMDQRRSRARDSLLSAGASVGTFGAKKTIERLILG